MGVERPNAIWFHGVGTLRCVGTMAKKCVSVTVCLTDWVPELIKRFPCLFLSLRPEIRISHRAKFKAYVIWEQSG